MIAFDLIVDKSQIDSAVKPQAGRFLCLDRSSARQGYHRGDGTQQNSPHATPFGEPDFAGY
ncbi:MULTISPECIES: hypothetical protein [unclassified Pigmentiphaga]|uniref:hypothetical protein n=1 Tax=unclassified Pigmentiphaga TaxID=2626614 RepID=UPI001052E048|nr:hypothetical protein [Pigmentiphaga sp. D-2]